MSLFQCYKCGCVENTATCSVHSIHQDSYSRKLDVCSMSEFKGKELCFSCEPKVENGAPSKSMGDWHGIFPIMYLPIGEFITDEGGNLKHIKTGRTDYRSFEIMLKN